MAFYPPRSASTTKPVDLIDSINSGKTSAAIPIDGDESTPISVNKNGSPVSYNGDVEQGLIFKDDELQGEESSPSIWSKLNFMPHGGVAASGFNFAAASMGAGTLCIPAAYKAAGSLLGCLFLALICIATVYSIRLLGQVVESTGYNTFEQMARGLYGRKTEKVVAFLIVIFCWGCTVAYVCTVGDVLKKFSAASWFPTVFTGAEGNRIVTAIYWFCFMLPLSMAKEINSLRYASTIGVISTMILVTSVVIHAATSTTPAAAKKNLSLAEFDLNMVISLPVFIFSYCCQTNTFEIYAEMKPKTVRQLTKTSGISITMCTIIYIIVGLAGLANFGGLTDGDILNNLDPLAKPYLSVAFFAVTITVTCAFPICMFPTRDSILQLMGYSSVYETPSLVRMAVIAVLSVASLVLGIYVPGLQIVLGLLGGICGSSVAFICPALFYMRGVDGGFSRANVGTANWFSVWLLLVIGFLAGLLGTGVSIYTQFFN